MKTETTSATAETTAAKQAWIEPTLTKLSVPLETCAMTTNGMDGGPVSTNMT